MTRGSAMAVAFQVPLVGRTGQCYVIRTYVRSTHKTFDWPGDWRRIEPMLSAEQNDFITKVGPGAPAGNLLRRYWQPAALVDELDAKRPVKPIKLLGEDLVLFRDDKGR